ncbi:MAG: CAP domain-containing protein, partial [Bryobacterales bacterium]|nr:CAP domain-containing protein [Bryobacterales bacterium]
MKWTVILLPALLSAQIVELGPAPRAPQPPSTKAITAERPATNERSTWYDTSNRETVRQAYLNTFTSVSMGWTGAIAGCLPGATSSAWRNSAAARINWFRAMAGVPPVITLNDTYNTKDQQAALMMSANRALNHTPPSGWTCYTADGFDGAGNSNLCLSYNSTPEPGCVSQYIEDSGLNNYFVGHRRWVLHPQTQQMGTGDVEQTGSYPGSGYPYANALWVFDGHTFDARPAVRETGGFVAWPPRGYVPYQKVFPRWSFAYPGANFAGATITMNGSSTGVVKETLNNDAGYGENTLVWTWSGQPSGVPASDTTVTVTISGITGAPQSSYTYQVIIFDPATSGGGGGTTAVTVTTNPTGRTFTVDGASYSSPQVFNWTPGSQHTIATASPQSSGGTRYNFANWSDAGPISHSITTPASAATYTANFTTQYLLTTTVSPNGSGSISPSPSSADGYYNAGAVVQLTAS